MKTNARITNNQTQHLVTNCYPWCYISLYKNISSLLFSGALLNLAATDHLTWYINYHFTNVVPTFYTPIWLAVFIALGALTCTSKTSSLHFTWPFLTPVAVATA